MEATLVYYVGVLAEEIPSYPGFGDAVADGTLAEALHHAALLLRLLNDTGTTLLAGADEQRAELVRALEGVLARDRAGHGQMAALLMASAREVGPVLTRIHKDVAHGEFNLAIHGLLGMRPEQGIPTLARRLARLSRLYGEHKALLDLRLDSLSRRLGDDTIRQVIGRFVAFHEDLYAHGYQEPSGEYAV